MKRLAWVGLVVSAASVAGCDNRFHLVGIGAAQPDGGSDASYNGAPDGGTGGTGGSATGTGGAGSAFGTGGGTPGPVDAGVGAETMLIAISPREAITRLTRVLWESPPDGALMTMAASGAVMTNADVRRVALDVLADPRSRVGVAHFYHWWLDLDRMATTAKDPALFPQFSSNLGDLMVAETEAFGVDVTLNGDGRFPSLLQASYSFLNQSLAGLYGVSGITGSELRRVDLDPTQRAGIFTHPSVLTINSSPDTWTSPTYRGILIANKMLCVSAPAPVGDAAFAFPQDAAPPRTNRQRLEASVSSSACTTCHRFFDPLGLAYEKFDSIGRVRLTDAGMPIDASGQLASFYGDPVTFDGAIDLAGILAGLPRAHRCMGSKWLEYIVGRDITEADGPAVTGIHQLFEASNLSLPALIAAAVSSPAFLKAGGGTACTPGLDETCNHTPSVAEVRGTCTAAGRCVCRDPSLLQTATGRCG